MHIFITSIPYALSFDHLKSNKSYPGTVSKLNLLNP